VFSVLTESTIGNLQIKPVTRLLQQIKTFYRRWCKRASRERVSTIVKGGFHLSPMFFRRAVVAFRRRDAYNESRS